MYEKHRADNSFCCHAQILMADFKWQKLWKLCEHMNMLCYSLKSNISVEIVIQIHIDMKTIFSRLLNLSSILIRINISPLYVLSIFVLLFATIIQYTIQQKANENVSVKYTIMSWIFFFCFSEFQISILRSYAY